MHFECCKRTNMPSGTHLILLFLTSILGDVHLEAIGSARTQMSIPRKACAIPTFSDYYYLSLDGNKLDPEKCYDGSGKFAVRLICFNPTRIIDPVDFAICFDGQWYQSDRTTCVQRTCEPVYDTLSTHHRCTTPKGVEVNCRLPSAPDTKITIRCAHWRYELKNSRVFERFCQTSGQWQSLEECRSVCGLVSNNSRIDDDSSLRTVIEYPWNAVIFRYKDDEWNQVCVGTVISEFLIVTANSCFPEDIVIKENIKVAVGKYFKYYTDYDENLVYDVMRVDSYKQHSISIVAVEKYIEFSDAVGAACLMKPGASLVQEEVIGQIIAWGKNRHQFTMPLQCVSHKKCRNLEEISAKIPSGSFFCCLENNHSLAREQLGGGLMVVGDQDEFHRGVVLKGVLVELLNEGRIPIYIDLGSDYIRLFFHKYIEEFYDWLSRENKYWFRKQGDY